MKSYNNFIGIDIGKFSFVVSQYGIKKTQEYANTELGINEFIEYYSNILPESLSILEVTGGHEMALLLSLCGMGFSVHRANTRKVKNFIRSYGNEAKTDQLDARALALYGSERFKTLLCYVPQSKEALCLSALAQRLLDLKKMRVAEKNRKQGPMAKLIINSCQIMIDTLTIQIDSITEQMNEIIKNIDELNRKKAILQTIPGIGPVISTQLIILMPELGSLNRREAASLAGVAPRSNDSGCFNGYRSTAPGRDCIKPMLFTAAMAASKSNSSLREFYLRLLDNGKKKMVALVALMRKIIVIANARIKEEFNQVST
jgi:transposase